MKNYETIREIEQDLRIYELKYKIAAQEVKSMGFKAGQGILKVSTLKTILIWAIKYGWLWVARKNK